VCAVAEEKRIAVAIEALGWRGAESGFRVVELGGELLGCTLNQLLGSSDGGGGFEGSIAGVDEGAGGGLAGGDERVSERSAGGDVRVADEQERIEREAGHVLDEDDLFAGGLESVDGGGKGAPIEPEICCGGGDACGRRVELRNRIGDSGRGGLGVGS